MKTTQLPIVTLTNEQKELLKQLQNDYKIQLEKQQQPTPNIYYVMNYRERVVDPNFESSETEIKYYVEDMRLNFEELKEHLEKYFKNELRNFCEDYDIEELSEETDELNDFLNELGIYSAHLVMEAFEVQPFLTYQAAEEHLKSNYYHYHKKAFISRARMWRNEQFDSLINFLYQIPLDDFILETNKKDIEGPHFHMYRLGKTNSVHMTFVNEKGEFAKHYFSGPPSSISHVDKSYLEEKFRINLSDTDVDFIKNEYSEQIKHFRTV